jgi:2-polyprenyl-6-methoxyphenol hydroxylase-like FAD-dependent oxidoreductase
VVHARTLELLEARGVADAVLGSGNGWATAFELGGGVDIDLSGLPSRYPGVLVTPQYNVDTPLKNRARRLGVEIRYGTEVVDVDQDEHGVTVLVRTDSRELAYRARYLVGADGTHSAVRRAAGVPFSGEPFLRSMMLADVKLSDPPPPGVVRSNGGNGGFAMLAPYGNGWWRVTAWDEGWSRTAPGTPVELAHLVSVLRRSHGRSYGIHSPRWTSRFDADSRLADTYRAGRVLLVGDAAHQHSPAGGQSMNLGIQDAANLSWRLAEVVRGAPDRLLDGYTEERLPVARDVLRSSSAMLRLLMSGSRLGRVARRTLGRAALAVPPVARTLSGRLSGIGVRYPRSRGEHRLVGMRAPDVPLPDGTPLHRALRPGQFLLLSPHATPDGHDGRVRYVPATVDGVAALIRPDGYIAWAGNPTSPTTPTPLLSSLYR